MFASLDSSEEFSGLDKALFILLELGFKECQESTMVDIGDMRIPPRVDLLPLGDKETKLRGDQKGHWVFEIDGDVFSYRQKKILFNGKPFNQHLDPKASKEGAQYWTMLAKKLTKYRGWMASQMDDAVELGQFLAMAHALLTKLYGKLKKKFDETMDGVQFHLESGELWINGISISACLNAAQKKRSERVKIYLKGLRHRLTVLQANRMGNPSYEKIRDTVDRLALDLEKEVESYSDVIALPSPKIAAKNS